MRADKAEIRKAIAARRCGGSAEGSKERKRRGPSGAGAQAGGTSGGWRGGWRGARTETEARCDGVKSGKVERDESRRGNTGGVRKRSEKRGTRTKTSEKEKGAAKAAGCKRKKDKRDVGERPTKSHEVERLRERKPAVAGGRGEKAVLDGQHSRSEKWRGKAGEGRQPERAPTPIRGRTGGAERAADRTGKRNVPQKKGRNGQGQTAMTG